MADLSRQRFAVSDGVPLVVVPGPVVPDLAPPRDTRRGPPDTGLRGCRVHAHGSALTHIKETREPFPGLTVDGKHFHPWCAPVLVLQSRTDQPPP